MVWEIIKFNNAAYAQRLRGRSKESVQQEHLAIKRRLLSALTATGLGIAATFHSIGVSTVLAGLSFRRANILEQKKMILEQYMATMGWDEIDMDFVDVALAVGPSAVANVVGYSAEHLTTHLAGHGTTQFVSQNIGHTASAVHQAPGDFTDAVVSGVQDQTAAVVHGLGGHPVPLVNTYDVMNSSVQYAGNALGQAVTQCTEVQATKYGSEALTKKMLEKQTKKKGMRPVSTERAPSTRSSKTLEIKKVPEAATMDTTVFFDDWSEGESVRSERKNREQNSRNDRLKSVSAQQRSKQRERKLFSMQPSFEEDLFASSTIEWKEPVPTKQRSKQRERKLFSTQPSFDNEPFGTKVTQAAGGSRSALKARKVTPSATIDALASADNMSKVNKKANKLWRHQFAVISTSLFLHGPPILGHIFGPTGACLPAAVLFLLALKFAKGSEKLNLCVMASMIIPIIYSFHVTGLWIYSFVLQVHDFYRHFSAETRRISKSNFCRRYMDDGPADSWPGALFNLLLPVYMLPWWSGSTYTFLAGAVFFSLMFSTTHLLPCHPITDTMSYSVKALLDLIYNPLNVAVILLPLCLYSERKLALCLGGGIVATIVLFCLKNRTMDTSVTRLWYGICEYAFKQSAWECLVLLVATLGWVYVCWGILHRLLFWTGIAMVVGLRSPWAS